MSQEHSPATLSEDRSDATARMLPCPSCGETDVDATFAAGVKGGEREERFYNAGCMVCGMTGPDSHTAQDAADRWNALPRTTVSETPQKEMCKAGEFGCECGRPDTEPCPLPHPRSALSATRPICPFCNPAALGPNSTRAEGPPPATRKHCATCPFPLGCMVGDCND